jgi:hypothetical protein
MSKKRRPDSKVSDAALLARVKAHRCLHCNLPLQDRELYCRECDRQAKKRVRPAVLTREQFQTVVRNAIRWLEANP